MVTFLADSHLYLICAKVCCSDHESFHEQGFPASQVFERAGSSMLFNPHSSLVSDDLSVADPMYHNSGTTFFCLVGPVLITDLPGDISERPGYNFAQVKSIAKVQACIFSRFTLASRLMTCHQFATLLHATGFDLL